MQNSDPARSPSLLHLLKHFAETPEETAANLIRARRPSIRVVEARDYLNRLFLGDDLEWLARQAAQRNDGVGKTAVQTLTLCKDYIDQNSPLGYQPLGKIILPISHNLELPIGALGRAVVDGQCRVVETQIWKTISPTAPQFSVWWAFVKRGAQRIFPEITGLHWLEMSKPIDRPHRELRLRDETAARVISDDEFEDIRQHLALAVNLYRAAPKPDRKPKPKEDPDQPELPFR